LRQKYNKILNKRIKIIIIINFPSSRSFFGLEEFLKDRSIGKLAIY